MKFQKDQTGIAHLMLPLLVVIVLVVGFAGYRVLHATKKNVPPLSTTTSIDNTEKAAAKVAVNDDAAANPDKTFNIVVNNNKTLVSGPSTISVNKGDKVRVNMTATSEEAKVHLDGYDITTEADPSDDTPGGFSFIADQTGSFKFYAVGETATGDEASAPHYQLGTIVVK